MTDPDAAALIQRLRAIAGSCRAAVDAADIHKAADLLTARETALQNEGVLLRQLSDALTGGNAGTWEELIHAAGKVAAVEAALATAQQERDWATLGKRKADEALEQAEAERDALRDQVAQLQQQKDAAVERLDIIEAQDEARAATMHERYGAEQAALVSQLRSLIQTWQSLAHDGFAKDEGNRLLLTCARQVETMLPPDAPQETP